ncbi:MAG: VIT1/CCC1 transporter family protein [Gammaproteobacteria bacterium]
MHKHDHTPDGIQKRFSSAPEHSYLRDWVYGGLDGAVTTFALVAGAIGANSGHTVILLLGLTNIIADGFSMAAANFLATKTERDEHKYYESIEKKHVRYVPHGEKHEIKQIFRNKGFRGDILKKIVQHVTKNKKLWVNTMLREEYGLPQSVRCAWRAAVCTFLSFAICGSIPLIPFIFSWRHSVLISAIATGAVFFAIGSVKSLWSVHAWWKPAFLVFGIGAFTALLGFLVGEAVKIWV